MGTRPVVELELQQVQALLEKHGMTLGVVRTTAERTFEAAVALGLATRLEDSTGAVEGETQPANSNRTGEQHFVYRGNLRSGQRLEKTEHVLVIGDVNPGAEIISAGDVLVWGRVRGIVHAGVDGDERAIVLALDLDPGQLKIADLVAVAADAEVGSPAKWLWRRNRTKRPEIAYVENDKIIVETWDESKPGGVSFFRR